MPMWQRMNGPGVHPVSRATAGFTLVEVLVAITIVGLVLVVSVPSSQRFFESMQYRQAVRDVVGTLASARYRAVQAGVPLDVLIDPGDNSLQLGGDRLELPETLSLQVQSAREVNRDGKGVIRFYPEGGSSGGDVAIRRPGGAGTRVTVDWLAGRVSHAEYAGD